MWTGQGLVLVVVALAPWLGVLAVVGVGLWVLIRKSMRRRPRERVLVAERAETLPEEPPPLP